MDEVNSAYNIGLTHRRCKRPRPGDDDGSFINAGYPHAVGNFGSYPDAYPTYHTEQDIPEDVDITNVKMVAQASLAAGLRVDTAEEGI